MNFVDAAKNLRLREHFNLLSMGMTHDYKVAVAEGANVVRIGTAIFGERLYPQV